MSGLASVPIAATIMVIVLAVLIPATWIGLRRRRAAPVWPDLVRATQGERRRTLVAIGFAVALLLIGASTAVLFPQWLGLGAAVTPAVAGAGGLALYAATPPSEMGTEHSRRSASLQPRRPVTVAPRGSVVAFGGAVMLQLTLLALTGLTSSTDDLGLRRAITFATDFESSTSGPYPGWFYGLPLAGATLLLVASTWFALRRIAGTASLPGVGLENLDRMWRAKAAKIVITLAGAGVWLQIGGVSAFAGISMANARLSGTATGWQVLATCLLVLSALAVMLGMASLVLAATRAFALPAEAARAHGPVRLNDVAASVRS